MCVWCGKRKREREKERKRDREGERERPVYTAKKVHY